MNRLTRVLKGIILGSVPGVFLILLTGPVSGEIELTLGVGGIFLALVGALVGGALGARRPKGQVATA